MTPPLTDEVPETRVGEVLLYMKLSVVDRLFAFANPFNVALEVDTLEAAAVVTDGAEEVDAAVVVKFKIRPSVVPLAFVAVRRK